MLLGKVNTLKVLRETDIAYLLTDGTDEVFLHKKEAKKPYLDNEDIDVFLYADNQGRITASTKEPLITLGDVKMLEVVSINPKYGVFLYYGMVKDLLLSLDDLPTNKNQWPQINDRLFVEMIEKKGQLYGHIIGRKQITDYYPDTVELEDDTYCEAYVMYIVDHGIVAFTEQGHEVFIHKNNFRDEYHIGEYIKPKIIKRNPSGEYVGTLIEQKEIMLEKDALIILEYLEENDGVMEYTDKTDANTISEVFHMSKSAFKRALGTLYKAKKIELNKKYTKKV
jgi:predicted RNA-binding protein (virulence factor B family)